MKGTISEQDFINFTVLLEHLDELKVAINIIMQDHGLNKGASSWWSGDGWRRLTRWLTTVLGRRLDETEQFLRATKAALRGRKNEQLVTPLQIDILFALFDLDGTSLLYGGRPSRSHTLTLTNATAGDGHLSPKEFIHVMEKRKDGGFNEVGCCDFVVAEWAWRNVGL